MKKSKELHVTPKQTQAIIALLEKPTIKSAAKWAGVNETTLHRWFQLPAFREDYYRARTDLIQHSMGRLQKACGVAVETLKSIMADPSGPASARVSAARTTLEMAIRSVELEDLQQRVDRLDREMAKMRGI